MLNDAPLPLQTASPAPISDARAPVAFGVASLDAACRGGLARGALHEIYAATAADAASATGFALGLGCRAAGDKPIVWVRQDYLDTETGRLNAMGLLELGLDPGRIILVRAHNATDVLRAAGEAARCSAVGALLIEPWGTPRVLDLTASRRLTLATAKSGVTALMLRVCSSPSPSSAVTRWRVQPRPSAALAANAPGFPVFSATLLRNRYGVAQREWLVEWNRDQRCFLDRSGTTDAATKHAPICETPIQDTQISGRMVPLPRGRPAGMATPQHATLLPGVRRAG